MLASVYKGGQTATRSRAVSVATGLNTRLHAPTTRKTFKWKGPQLDRSPGNPFAPDLSCTRSKRRPTTVNASLETARKLAYLARADTSSPHRGVHVIPRTVQTSYLRRTHYGPTTGHPADALFQQLPVSPDAKSGDKRLAAMSPTEELTRRRGATSKALRPSHLSKSASYTSTRSGRDGNRDACPTGYTNVNYTTTRGVRDPRRDTRPPAPMNLSQFYGLSL